MTEEEYKQAITAGVREALANNGTLAGLQQRLDAMTSPKLEATFSDEEQAAMAKAVADLRERKALEIKEHEEEAKLNEFRQEVRRAGITGGYIAPETAEEKQMWRDAHGTHFDGHLKI